MRRLALAPLALTAAAVLASAAPAAAGGGRSGFGFNSDTIGAGGNGLVTMNGGGSYDLAGTIRAGGHFDCDADVVNGPLAGCLAGDGTHWKAASLLATTNFRCGTAGEVTKSASSDAHTAVFVAEFFRTGDGSTPSFTSQVIVADHDIAADVPGVQNVWIQLVGCASATANFNG